ncbi:MAG: O-antigen ligase family protein [Flavobacteriales bacterium]|jgi:teichuronic acid biosynthesis protein TuaE|nr:O-antigen ligase family protein [Flavobacteriales bacterium]
MLKLKENIVYVFLAAALIGLGLSYGKIYAFHLVFFVSFALFPFKKAKYFFLNKPSFIPVFPALMFLFYLLSMFWAPNFFYSIQYLGYLFFGVAIIYITYFSVNNIKQLKNVFIVLGSVLLVEVLICLLEMYSSFRYPISPYSKLVTYFGHGYKIDQNLSSSVKSLILSVPTGFHWNPNNLATLLSLAIPFTLLSTNKWIKYLGSLLLLLVLGATNSRGVMLSVSIMILFIFLKEFTFSKKTLLAIMSLCLILFIVPTKLNPFSSVNNRISDSIDAVFGMFENKQTSNSLGARQELMKNALDDLDENLWLGTGAGNSKFIQEKNGKVAGKLTSLHNFWLEILVDAGIVFFLIFISWYFLIVNKLFKISSINNPFLSYVSKASAIALLGLLISAVSCSSIIYFFPFWILISLSLVVYKISENKNFAIC